MYSQQELNSILTSLISLPAETEIVEFKKAENSFSDNDLGEYFSALSNEANLKGATMAWLVFGVDNNTHKVLGTNYKPTRPSLDEMKKKIADQTTNRITFDEIYELTLNREQCLSLLKHCRGEKEEDDSQLTYNSKRIILFQIPAAPQGLPIAYKGHYYGRDNESLVALNLHEIELIRSQATTKDWSAEVVPDATIKDIDSQAIKYFINEGIDKGRLPESTKHENIQKVLDSLNLLAPNGKLKRAAILLFGKQPLKFFSGIRFRIGRFGQGETDLISQDVIEGNIIQMADRVVEILKNKYLISTIDYDGLKRKEVLEVPVIALREILYNALAHKDYNGTDIQMQVFSNRIVVWNEGQLPQGYTLETLMQPHKSRAKNQTIADVFYRAGFIETWGRGIGKVREEMEAHGLKMPVWRNTCGGIEVTIEREIYQKLNPEIGTIPSEIGTISSKIGTILLKSGTISTESGTTKRNWREEISKKKNLQKRQIALLIQLMEEVVADNTSSYTDLEKKTGKARSTIQKYMLYLSDNCFIKRIGTQYDGYWEIL